jgi:hypothetical protein
MDANEAAVTSEERREINPHLRVAEAGTSSVLLTIKFVQLGPRDARYTRNAKKRSRAFEKTIVTFYWR